MRVVKRADGYYCQFLIDYERQEQHQKGKKQSRNYHNQRKKVAKLHLKVSRQRKDKAIKDALALIKSLDLIVYEALKVRNLVKNHRLSKSISDASWESPASGFLRKTLRNLSRLVEQGISNSNVERIPRQNL